METDQGKHPACFSSRKFYELWLDSPYQQDPAARHCADCLPSFKMRMVSVGRCEHPETVFSFEQSSFDGEDGVEIVGHWKRIPVLETKAAPQATDKAAVQVDASASMVTPAVAAPKPRPVRAPKQQMWKPSFFELQRAIAEDFTLDPSPITVADMTQICREDGSMKVGIPEVMRVMRALWAIGILEKGFRLSQKHNGTVDHYWGKAWKE